MYSRTTWGGPVDPFILVKFLNAKAADGADPIASLIVFQWQDKDLVGIPDENIPGPVSLWAGLIIGSGVMPDLLPFLATGTLHRGIGERRLLQFD